MNFSNLRIGTKLWLAVLTLVAVLACVVGFAAWRSSQVTAESDAGLTLAERKINLATRWAGMTESAVGRIVLSGASAEPAVQALVNQSTAKAIAEINELQKQLNALPRDAAESAQMDKVAELRKNLLDVTARMKATQANNPTPEARAAGAAAVANAAEPYLQAQAEFVKMEQDRMEQMRAGFRAQRTSMLVVVGVVIALLLAGIVAGAAVLIRAIRQPLAQAVDLAGAIAAGDLTRRSATGRGDEFGDLMRALDAMSDALASTVGQVRSAADQIATGTGQIAVGNQDLSQRTEEQASSLQETAASMEQLGSTVRANADAARQATELASAASTVAVAGGTAVGEVVSTMHAISESSRRIADIIGTIDGIAFQTNILALNAAVEAARAGEQGRGFAVVAGEVRSLAHRAADAAREIKDLIQDSVAKVERGSLQVSQAGRTMTDIVTQVKRVNDLIGEISAATLEQTTGIGQVGHTVTQLDRVTQQNAALVEESAAAAASLNQQAARLVEAVGAFTLGESEARLAIAQARATSKPASAPVRAPAPRVVRTAAPRASVAAAADGDDWQTF